MTEETFGNYLQRRFHEWVGKQLGHGRRPSQADFAKWIGVSTSNLSVWMNDMRLPTGGSVDRLADKLGVEVYDRLGVSRRMPRNKKLYWLASVWDKLPEQAQAELYERARNIYEGKEDGPTNLVDPSTA